MGIPLYRLPLLIQLLLYMSMELQEKFFIATLSKRSRRLSSVLCKRQLVEIEYKFITRFKISIDEDILNWDLNSFQKEPDTNMGKALRNIFVPSEDAHLDTYSAYWAHGRFYQAIPKMIEFLFDVFTIRSILLTAVVIRDTVMVLDAVHACKVKSGNEMIPVKVVYFVGSMKQDNFLPLHCDELSFLTIVTAAQLVQMGMKSKRVIVPLCYRYYIPTAGLKEIFEAWMEDNSLIEYMELPYKKRFFFAAMKKHTKRNVMIDGEIKNVYVIRQESGKEAAVYHNYFDIEDRDQEVILRTDFEEVEEANE